MASTYSDLKIELIGTGEQVGTWGATTNTNLGTALEEAITGSADVTFSSADVTLTLSNTNGTQTARNLRLVCTGTSGGARQLILDSGCQIEKLYLIQNDLADAVTVINGDGSGGTSGTGVAVPAGAKRFVFNDGTNVVEAININLASGISGTLPVVNGGTGQTKLHRRSTTYWGNVTGSSGSTTGNAATATALQTARTIGGVSFNGTANINLPGVNQAGTQNTSGNADTATKLTTASGSAPSYSARAWVNFNGQGVIAIRASGNVSSITDNGAGLYRVNFSTALPSINYAPVFGLSDVNGGAIAILNALGEAVPPSTFTTSGFNFGTYANVVATKFGDPIDVCVSVFN
jgi:hypothetical protein